LQRAVLRAENLGRDATGADILVGIFDETESHAAWFLGNQDMTQDDAANSILHAIVRAGKDLRSGPHSS